jgi:ribosome-binding ATPase
VRIGIIGLANSGKTTVFNALTGSNAPTAAYTGGTFQVNTATVPVPDERVARLGDMYQPKRVTYTRVEFADIAGLSREKDVSLSGELLNAIGANDALLHVVRCFEGDPLASLDPARDIAALDAELLLTDLARIETRLERLSVSLKRGKVLPTFESEQKEFDLLNRLRAELEKETPVRDLDLAPDEEKLLRGFQFLSLKPVLLVLNVGDEEEPTAVEYPHLKSAVTSIRGRLEMEIGQLDAEDAALFLAEYGLTQLSLVRVVKQISLIMDRIVFFTVGDEEVRAWEVRQGASALECAATVHSDLARGFIRAEVVPYQELVAAKSMAAARSAGKVGLEGKDYAVKDGDVLTVRFNV